ncbi:MAG: sigma 54-interacting transcriptional regulator, partial [Proteobacteria bacterium]|nr:sigma 54-interacting transcriptional regulator [Pseudomonadota bacterium]
AQNTATPVLILGESGTGKELVAREVHSLSGAKGPFVDLNCASLNENLLESELFGHEKGAFTDARQAKQGLFEVAAGGSLFFDELTEMPPSVQAKLLRVLDSGAFRRVGGVREVRSDARVMAATNRNVERAVAEGKFREDLFYRLSVFPVRIPPLRDRPDDVAALSQYFLATLGERLGKPHVGLSGTALERLREYAWPGNVRELRNVIERALILCDGAEVEARHLPAEVRAAEALRPRARIISLRPLDAVVEEHIARVVRAADGNHSRAARILGISRSTLLARLKKSRQTPDG